MLFSDEIRLDGVQNRLKQKVVCLDCATEYHLQGQNKHVEEKQRHYELKWFLPFLQPNPRNKKKQHSCVPACIVPPPRLNRVAEQYSTRAAILSYSATLRKGTEQPRLLLKSCRILAQ